MKLLIVVGWKSRSLSETPEIIYSGLSGPDASKAAELARQSGKYQTGWLKRKLITDWVPLPCTPTAALPQPTPAPKPATVSSTPPQRKARHE